MALARVTGELKRRVGVCADPNRASAVAGGGINRAFKLPSDTGALFIKLNEARVLSAFEAEAEGLEALRAAGGVPVPRTVDVGCTGGTAYLALDWIELSARTAAAEDALGQGLARQHRATAEFFGWHRENTIGATPQSNTPASSWLDFLRRERLGFQLELAVERGLPSSQRTRGDRLMQRLEWFFRDYEPVPALLHGDLWSGNWGSDPSDTPYIFDPAVYYGDREADLAMTRLFGGFGSAFYSAYQDEWPLAAGWETRVDLYNLYHLLNHFNLFGGSYLQQIEQSLTRLLSASA